MNSYLDEVWCMELLCFVDQQFKVRGSAIVIEWGLHCVARWGFHCQHGRIGSVCVALENNEVNIFHWGGIELHFRFEGKVWGCFLQLDFLMGHTGYMPIVIKTKEMYFCTLSYGFLLRRIVQSVTRAIFNYSAKLWSIERLGAGKGSFLPISMAKVLYKDWPIYWW